MFSIWSTGIDSEGHAANFVETEQIVLYEGTMASFIQASIKDKSQFSRVQFRSVK